MCFSWLPMYRQRPLRRLRMPRDATTAATCILPDEMLNFEHIQKQFKIQRRTAITTDDY